MSDKFRDVEKWRFERNQLTPLAWHNSSMDLYAAAAALEFSRKGAPADAIKKQFGFDASFDMAVIGSAQRMLFAMSLELLYKAISVATDGQAPPRSHNLIKLAMHVGLQVDPTESDALKLLTHSIRWEGRYPIPLELEEFRQFHAALTVMSDPRPVHPTLRGRRPSTALDWSHCARLWNTANALFEKREQERQR